MTVTAKFLAEKLNLSQTAVSMALNNKPGVSTETRKRVLKAAEKYGYDFSKLYLKDSFEGSIFVVIYKAKNIILSYSPIFDEYLEGIQRRAKKEKIHVNLLQIWENVDDLDHQLEEIRGSDCLGIILIGTEISSYICKRFTSLSIPTILLDSFLEDVNCDSVLINNETGAYKATEYLINTTNCQPGYILSSYRIPNFEERLLGYKKAIRSYGMSYSRAITHETSPTFDGAYSDMLQIIKSNEPLAKAYFCENDILAISAIRAFSDAGYKVPDDVAIIGFDNIQESKIVSPALTTMDVSRGYLGEAAVNQLLTRLQNYVPSSVKIAITPQIIKRKSV